MVKKAITLHQMEEALRDFSLWLREVLREYIAEPAAEGKSGYVLSTNGDGGRSWEYIPGLGELPDKTLTVGERAADAAAVGAAIARVQAAAESAQATANGITAGSIGAEEKRLQFAGVVVEAFEADTTYADFPYRAAVALEGATAGMLPEVVFGADEAVSGAFAPVAESYDGGIYIYAAEKPETAVTIPTIVLWR